MSRAQIPQVPNGQGTEMQFEPWLDAVRDTVNTNQNIAFQNRDAWSGTANYDTNDFVNRNGSDYRALQPSLNRDPATQTAYWKLFGGAVQTVNTIPPDASGNVEVTGDAITVDDQGSSNNLNDTLTNIRAEAEPNVPNRTGTATTLADGDYVGLYQVASNAYAKFTVATLRLRLFLSLFTAKGQLLAGTGTNTVAALGVGSNGQTLVADSTTATGLKWGGVADIGAAAAVHTHTSSQITDFVQAARDALENVSGAPVQTIADLRAVAPARRQDKQERFVEDVTSIYAFNAEGTGTDDGDGIIAPTTGTGRWFKIGAGSTTNAATLQGQNGAYYLNRANHTGTQAGSTVTGLYTASGLTISAPYKLLGRTSLAGSPSGAEEISVSAPIVLANGALSVPNFIASGASAASGLVPTPGTTAGTTRFLREDATWQAVAAGVSSVNSKTGAVSLAAADIPATNAQGGATTTQQAIQNAYDNSLQARNQSTATVTATSTIAYGISIQQVNSASATTQTLPDRVDNTASFIGTANGTITVKNLGAGLVTVTAPSGKTIDGGDKTLTQGQSLTFYPDGTVYRIYNPPVATATVNTYSPSLTYPTRGVNYLVTGDFSGAGSFSDAFYQVQCAVAVADTGIVYVSEEIGHKTNTKVQFLVYVRLPSGYTSTSLTSTLTINLKGTWTPASSPTAPTWTVTQIS